MQLDITTVGKMKTAELEALISAYEKAGVVLPEGGLKAFNNNTERADFIESVFAEKQAYPHELTEEDFEKNDTLDPDLKVGDVILVPVPPEKDETDEGDDENSANEGNDDEEDKNTGDDNNEPNTTTEEVEVGDELTDELIEAAIKTGNLKYEGRVITSYRPQIAHGRLRYLLTAIDASAYPVETEELDALVRQVL